MSQEAVVQFLDAVAENESLQQRLIAILESSENDRADTANLANEYGYDITPDELWAEIQKRQQDLEARQQAGELSDEELEAVAGGGLLLATAAVSVSMTAISAASAVSYVAYEVKNAKW